MFGHIGARPAKPAFTPPPPPAPPQVSETLNLDVTKGSATTSATLEQGRTYTVTVTGTVSDWNLPLDRGTPEGDTGIDAETIFAWPASRPHTAGHWTQLRIDTGSGAAHREPVGGPFSEPQPGHVYTYKLEGEGKPARFVWADSPLSDNSGAFTITVT